MSGTSAARSRHHPAAWRGLGPVELGVATETQRCLDLVEVGKLADALGVKIDIAAAIKSSASVSDVLAEIRDELNTVNLAECPGAGV